MELDGRKVVAQEHARECNTVVGCAGHQPLVGQIAIEGMDEIEVAVVRDSGEQRMLADMAGIAYLIPADLRNLLTLGQPPYAPTHHAKACMRAKLFALLAKYLHAYTNAKEWRSVAN